MASLATFYDHIIDISRQEGIPVMEAMQRVKELGVEFLEVSQNSVIGREDELGQQLSFAGLGISTIPSYFDFGRDRDVEKQSAPILESARFLGASRILVIPGFWDLSDSEEKKKRQLLQMREGVLRLSELSEKYGVSLVMEEYDSETAPFSTAEGVRGFLDACPKLSCAFDTGNFRFAAQDELKAYELLKDRISHVHLKDRAYRPQNGEEAKTAVDAVPLYPAPVGFGEIKIEELISRLRKDGYDGIYTIEHYGSNAMLDYLERSVKWVKARVG